MKIKFVLVIILLLSVSLLSGCVRVGNQVKTEYGVEIRCGSFPANNSDYHDIWINNTNNFSVRIQQIRLSTEETTMWIREFNPYECKYILSTNEVGWYIYTINGSKKGYIDFKIF